MTYNSEGRAGVGKLHDVGEKGTQKTQQIQNPVPRPSTGTTAGHDLGGVGGRPPGLENYADLCTPPYIYKHIYRKIIDTREIKKEREERAAVWVIRRKERWGGGRIGRPTRPLSPERRPFRAGGSPRRRRILYTESCCSFCSSPTRWASSHLEYILGSCSFQGLASRRLQIPVSLCPLQRAGR